MFYQGPNGLSVIFGHRKWQDPSLGDPVDVEFTQLSGDTEWVYTDAGSDSTFDSSGATFEWDGDIVGGVLRGGLENRNTFAIDIGLPVLMDDWLALGADGDNIVSEELAHEDTLEVFGAIGDNSVSASASTLQWIPGKEENPSKGGDLLNSALMHMIPEAEITVPGVDWTFGVYPILDGWIGGDMKDSQPLSLEEARKKKQGKYLHDAGQDLFNEYRIENGVEVSFDVTNDGSVVQDSVEIEFTETGPSTDDPVISTADRKPSKTVLHKDSDLRTTYFPDENVGRSNREPRLYEYDTEFEYDGVEGVRVMTVSGGWAAFMLEVANTASENAAEFFGNLWDWNSPSAWAWKKMLGYYPPLQWATDYLTTVPNTYSFIDFVVLADGRRFLRIWDASRYPSLAVYVDGKQRMAEHLEYEPRQLMNDGMRAFHTQAIAGITPYRCSAHIYRSILSDRSHRESLTIAAKEELDDGYVGDSIDELTRSIPWTTIEIDEFGESVAQPGDPFGKAEDLPLEAFTQKLGD